LGEEKDRHTQYFKLKRYFVDTIRLSKHFPVNIKVKLTKRWFERIYEAKAQGIQNIISPSDECDDTAERFIKENLEPRDTFTKKLLDTQRMKEVD